MSGSLSREFLILADGTVVGGTGERATDIASSNEGSRVNQAIGAYAVLSPDGAPIIAIAYPPAEVDFSLYD